MLFKMINSSVINTHKKLRKNIYVKNANKLW